MIDNSGKVRRIVRAKSAVRKIRVAKPKSHNHVNARSAVHATGDPAAYSLYSTDSESQVMAVYGGLDRCETMLNGLLEAKKGSNCNHMTTQCGMASAGDRRLQAPKQSSTPSYRKEKHPGVERQGKQKRVSVIGMKDRCAAGKQSHSPTNLVDNTKKPTEATMSCGSKETQTAVAAAPSMEGAKHSEQSVSGRLLEHGRLVGQTAIPLSNRQTEHRRHHSVPAAMPTGGQHHHPQRMLSPIWYPPYPYPYYSGCYPFVALDLDAGPSVAPNSDPASLQRLRQAGSVTENPRNLSSKNRPQQWPPWTLPFTCPPGVWPGSFSPSAPKPSQKTGRNKDAHQVVRTKLSNMVSQLKSLAAATGHCDIVDLVDAIDRELSTSTNDPINSAASRDGDYTDRIKRLERDKTQLKSDREHLQKRLKDLEERLIATQSSSSSKNVKRLKSELEKMEWNMAEMRETVEVLQSQNDVLSRAVHSSNQEMNKAMEQLIFKETENFGLQQNVDNDIGSLRRAVQHAEAQQQMTELFLEESEKKNSVLKLSLQQRRSEIDSLKEQVLGLRKCVAGLLIDKTRNGQVSKSMDEGKPWITPSVTLQRLEQLVQLSDLGVSTAVEHSDSISQQADIPSPNRTDDIASLSDKTQILSVVHPTIKQPSSRSCVDASLTVAASDCTFNFHKWLKQTSEDDENSTVHSATNSSTVSLSGSNWAITDCSGLQAADSDHESIHAVAVHEVKREQNIDSVSCTSTATWSVTEEDFRRDLAALDASIAQLQRQLLEK